MSFESESFYEDPETIDNSEQEMPNEKIGGKGIGSMSGDLNVAETEAKQVQETLDPEGDPGAISTASEENNYQSPTATEDEKPTTLTSKGIGSMSGNI